MHTKILADNQKKRRKKTESTANLFKSIKAVYNKRVAPKIGVANWQMKIMVSGAEPVWIAFDRREYRMQTVGWGKLRFKKVLIHVTHSRCEHYIFALWFLSSFFFSSPNLSRCRLDVYHTSDTCLNCEDIARQNCAMVHRWQFFASLLHSVFPASLVQHISDLHSKFALRPHHVWKYGRHPICGR